ncbi:MAG: retropepsin-like domain-containing protein [Chloroflexi bacterium]|nr:retropepsin-like domain-containing protein [Chloroflexota bacterium]
MRLNLQDDLPFVTVTITFRGVTLEIDGVLVDTGSASSVFQADRLAPLGVAPEPEDTLHAIGGIGGSEVVFTRNVERLQVETRGLENFEIEVGGMDYGFAIYGILGMDFLTRTGAVINLRDLTLEFAGS